jgi:hypothetical protein
MIASRFNMSMRSAMDDGIPIWELACACISKAISLATLVAFFACIME